MSQVKKMSGVGSRPSIPAIVEGAVVYNIVIKKAELFAKKFTAVSSDENLSANLLARCTEFELEQDLSTALQPAPTVNIQAEAPPGECDGITAPFEIHELSDALKVNRHQETRRPYFLVLRFSEEDDSTKLSHRTCC